MADTPPPRRRHHTVITIDSHDWQDFATQLNRIAHDVERHQRISVELISGEGYHYQSGENADWTPRDEYDAALLAWSKARRTATRKEP